MDDEKQSDKNNNESIEDQFNPEAEEIASSTASLNTVCERCDYEMRDVIMCDSYEMEARQALRVERTIYDQDEKLKNFFAEVKKHIKEYYFKVLVIGEIGAGKTSFINRYVHQHFSSNYRATIGPDFALKVINWSKNKVIRLQLWDIAGQERLGSMTRVYYKNAVGAFVIFDMTRKQSLDQVVKWKVDLDAKVCLSDGEPVPSVLLANKCDLDEEQHVINSSIMNRFCEKHKFSAWFYTSAKNNINVEESANFLISKVLEKHALLLESWKLNSDTLSLIENPKANRCSC